MQFVLKRCYFPDVSEQANLISNFFSSDEGENTLLDPVDQTIYQVLPKVKSIISRDFLITTSNVALSDLVYIYIHMSLAIVN